MKDKEVVYWKQRNGELISVDDMDINHLRNAFKHLIKHNANVVKQANELVDEYNALIRKRKAERGSASFILNGDMAQEFHESYPSDEDDDRFDE
jgi:hypothetical protein